MAREIKPSKTQSPLTVYQKNHDIMVEEPAIIHK